MSGNVIQEKSYQYAIMAVKLSKILQERREFTLQKQMVRSATSVGANVEEVLAGQSRADFVSKLSIARKEARESSYWIRLLIDTEYIQQQEAQIMLNTSTELIKILTSIILSTIQKDQKNS